MKNGSSAVDKGSDVPREGKHLAITYRRHQSRNGLFVSLKTVLEIMDTSLPYLAFGSLKTALSDHRNTIMSSNMITFCDGLVAAWDTKELSTQDFHDEQRRMWGEPGFQRFEHLTHNTSVKPYFDKDEWYGSEKPQNSWLEDLERACRSKVEDIFCTEPSFDATTQILLAQRHGLVPDDGRNGARWKGSVRVYVEGVRLEMGSMPTLIRELNQADFWDLSVYSSRQKLGILGSCKGNGDARVLTPVGGWDPSKATVQVLTGEEQGLEFDSTASTPRRALGLANAPPEWDEAFPVLEAHGFGNPRYRGRREESITFQCDCLGADCACCSSQHDRNNWWVAKRDDGRYAVKNYSDRCKVRLIGEASAVCTTFQPPVRLGEALKHLGIVQPMTEGLDRDATPCYWAQQHMQSCPTCAGQHKSDLWYVYPVLSECFSFRNSELECSQRLVATDQCETLKAILLNPTVDMEYVELFVSECKDTFKSNGSSIFRFTPHGWDRVPDAAVQTQMQNWLRDIFRKVHRLIEYEDHCVKHLGCKPQLIKLGSLKSMSSSLAQCLKHMSREGSMGNFLRAFRRTTGVYDQDFEEKRDSDPFLMQFQNGVVDLQSCEFRPSRPEDCCTMTTGYDFVQDPDPLLEAEVEDFMAKVYPHQDERGLFQLYAGYCQLGMHESKVALLLSDQRGGFNGKSTVLSLLEAAMGDYATKEDACILYKQDKARSVNDHNAGLLALEKKRLMMIEETDPSKVLDEEKIKDMNGGDIRLTGRQLYQTEVRSFRFITKTILAFNEGKMPYLNVEDTALMERLLTIPHRSRFYPGEVSTEPHSYQADSSIKRKFPEWAPYFFRWCLEGLRRYHTTAFRNVPDSCLSFKKQVMDDKNLVGAFLYDAVELGGSKDFVQIKELYNEYDTMHRSHQKDRKTHKSLPMFQAGVLKNMPGCRFSKKHSYRDASGVVRSIRSVIVNLKRRVDL